MGIYDRDYMQVNRTGGLAGRKPSLWQRLRFQLWRLWRALGGGART